VPALANPSTAFPTPASTAPRVDLGVQYRPPILRRSIELRLDVFNLLDRENLSGYSNNATQGNQFQVGARYAF
jgi:outer membrane receptor protein involved in Fe transport